MKVWRLMFAMVCLVVSVAGSNLQAQTPEYVISYQGRLTDVSGQPLDTTVSITFRVYDDTAGTTELFVETHPSVTVINGLFSVLLGSYNTLDAGLFSGPPVRGLSFQLDSGAESSPLVPLVSPVYAHRAGLADTAAFAF